MPPVIKTAEPAVLLRGIEALEAELAEARRAQAAVQESEATLRAFLESAAQGIVVVDESGAIIMVNAKTEEMFGYDRTDLTGRSLELLLPESLRASHAGHRRNYFAHPRTRPMGLGLELAGRRRDGSEFPVEISLSFIDAGGRKLAKAFITDITQRRRIEEEIRASMESLRRSEATVRALLESASQGVVVIDASGRIVLVNAKTEQMFGFTRDELLGAELEKLLPERFRAGHAGHRSRYLESPRERPMGLGMDLAARRKDGSEFPVEISLSYVASPQGNLAISFITDITARKRFEEQLRHTQKLESLGVLAGGVAHDFNNLLTAMMAGANMALNALAHDHAARKYLDPVIRATERAAGLTRQLLAYSGKGRFIVEPLDVSELVQDIAGLIHATIPKQVELRLELSSYLPRVDADPAQLHQLVMNLIINAAEAISGSPGTVSVRTSMADVSRSEPGILPGTGDLAPGRYILIEVRDNGSGMTDETLARIFDPFFTTKFTGRGLGLAAVLGIVRAHKGAIRVESRIREGSVFRVFLPVTEAESQPAASPSERRRLILVADDEELVRWTAQAAFESAGYSVLLAENGAQAIEYFSRMADDIGLILLDMSMPGLSGGEVLRQIHALRPAVPVIVSSGYSETEILERLEGNSVAYFLQKPYRADRLIEAAKSILDREPSSSS